jgi:peroxiredoxin
MKKQNHYNYESFGQCDLAAADFHSVTNVGSQAPQFTLRSLDGENVSLADFIGKEHVVLEFGSIT